VICSTMQIEDIVSVEEIETPRYPEEFVLWVEHILEQINRSNDPELKRQVFCRSGLVGKRFYEEILPLCALINEKRVSWHGARIQPALGSQTFDAKIIKGGIISP